MIDLEAISEKWLQQCGPCDYGMPEYACSHPEEDYRPVILDLVREVERLRKLALEAGPAVPVVLAEVADAP